MKKRIASIVLVIILLFSLNSGFAFAAKPPFGPGPEPGTTSLTLHYNPPNGTDEIVTVSANLFPVDVTVSPCNWEVPSGYWFSGWIYDNTKFFPPGYSFGASLSFDYTEVYALWTPVLSFDGQDGTNRNPWYIGQDDNHDEVSVTYDSNSNTLYFKGNETSSTMYDLKGCYTHLPWYEYQNNNGLRYIIDKNISSLYEGIFNAYTMEECIYPASLGNFNVNSPFLYSYSTNGFIQINEWGGSTPYWSVSYSDDNGNIVRQFANWALAHQVLDYDTASISGLDLYQYGLKGGSWICSTSKISDFNKTYAQGCDISPINYNFFDGSFVPSLEGAIPTITYSDPNNAGNKPVEIELPEDTEDYTLLPMPEDWQCPSGKIFGGWKISGTADQTSLYGDTFQEGETFNLVDNHGEELEPIWVDAAFCSLSLEGNIGVNAYFNLDGYAEDGDLSSVTVKVTSPNLNNMIVGSSVTTSYSGETLPEKETSGSAAGMYRFTASVAAAQMPQPVIFEVLVGDEIVKTINTSVKDLAEEYSNAKYGSAVNAVANSMLTYGKYSQLYFQYDTSHLACSDDMVDISKYDLNDTYINKTDSVVSNAEGASTTIAPGAAFVAKSNSELRFAYNGPKPDSASVTVDGVEDVLTVDIDRNPGYIYVSNIPASKLGRNIKLTISDGTHECSYQYNALNYAATVFKQTGYDALKNMMKALCCYYDAAYNYFNN